MKRVEKSPGLSCLLCITILIPVLVLVPSVLAASSEPKIIYDLPYCDNYGPAFSTWSGEGDMPLGTVLLKGTISVEDNTIEAGDSFELTLNLSFSGTMISGKYGAQTTETGVEAWYLTTEEFTGSDAELGEISTSEYTGIGAGQDIPPLMMRNVTRSYKVEIPKSAKKGTYDMYAYIEGTKFKTNPLAITIT